MEHVVPEDEGSGEKGTDKGASSAASRRLTPTAGQTPPAERPMTALQIDHTPVDLVLVDETWRKPVGRSWLPGAIDAYSRCITVLHLSYEAPPTTVAGLCLAHAALDKAAHLRKQGRAQVDEDAIFRAVAQQGEVVSGAAQRTRSARK